MSATANPHPFRNSKDPYGPRSDTGVDSGGRERERDREGYDGRRNRNSRNVKKNGADNNYNNSFINRFSNDDNKKENNVRRNSSQSVSVPFLSGFDEKMTNSIALERDQERDRRNNNNSNRDGEDGIKDEGGKGSERGRGDVDWDIAPLPDNWERRLDKESAKVRLLNGLLLLYYYAECTTTLLSSRTVFTSCSD